MYKRAKGMHKTDTGVVTIELAKTRSLERKLTIAAVIAVAVVS